MNLILKLTKLMLYFTVLCKVQGVLTNSEWINDVVEYIRQDATVFRNVLFVNQSWRDEDSTVNDVQRKILQRIPCNVIDIQGPEFTNEKFLPKYNGHLKTSLIITLLDLKNKGPQRSQELELKAILNHVSENYEHPKSLIILLHDDESYDYESLLRFAWSKQLLDFTILEHAEKQVAKNQSNNEVNFSFSKEIFVWMYYFNPLTNIYFKNEYLKGMILFPNKLKNLHGYKMKVVVRYYPPYVYVTESSTGNKTAIFGSEGMMSVTLSERLNFTAEYIIIKDGSFGRINCNKSMTTGWMHYLMNNKVRIAYNHSPYILCGFKYMMGYSKCTGFLEFYPVVPIVRNRVISITIPRESVEAVVIVLSLLLTVKIVMIIFKFDEYLQTVFNIFALSLGNGLAITPEKLSQRIVYCFILLGFFQFSSNIYGMFTGIKMTKESFVKLDTLEDIHNANLTPMMVSNALKIVTNPQANDVYQALIKKTIVNPSQEDCMLYLMKHMNITCVMPYERAKMFIEKFRIKYGFTEMKIGKEYFQQRIKGLTFEPGSPFIRGFDCMLSKLTDFGFVNKWDKDYYDFSEKTSQPIRHAKEMGSMTGLLLFLIMVFLIGMGSSLILFLCELLCGRLGKK